MHDPNRIYAGRREDIAVLNFSLKREAAEKLRAFAGGPGRKKLGAFVESLVHDYEIRQAREDERRRVEDRVVAALGKGDDEDQSEG